MIIGQKLMLNIQQYGNYFNTKIIDIYMTKITEIFFRIYDFLT